MFKLSVNNIKNWIFVTGVIRSGSTFVGKVLSLPLQVDYIHEPFNPICGMPGMKNFYRYIRPSLETREVQHYHELAKSIFDYKLTLRNPTSSKDSWSRKVVKKLVGGRGRFYLRLAKLNPFHQTAIIKDPTGNLLTEYLHVHFGVKPIIVIKHPLSFIASLKRVNWWPQPSEIMDQPHLIEDYFSQELEFVERKYPNQFIGSAAYWRATYKVLLQQASQYPSWQVLTIEELSQNPIPTFHMLYHNLDLPWSDRLKKNIIALTQGHGSAQARPGIVQDLQRNSADIFKHHRDSLSLTERREIFEMTQDIALQVYSRESFAID